MIGINIGSHLDCGSSSGSVASSAGSEGSGVAIAASWTRQLTIGGGNDGVSGTIQVQSA